MKETTMLHAFILALILNNCVKFPLNETVLKNMITQTIDTNVLLNAIISNGTLVVTATVASNQFNSGSSVIGTNLTPSQIIINAP
jgi:hypothetical protein